MIIKFPDEKSLKIFPEIVQKLRSRYTLKIIKYIIDSKYRTAINLKQWIRAQVNNPDTGLITFANEITTVSDPNAQMIHILKAVRKLLKYKSDSSVWGMLEKWQTALETLLKETGDCEDGAILIYVIARIKGISADQLWLSCGDVYDPYRKKEGGHCWLAYIPYNFPINWAFIDWCYYYDPRNIKYRNLYTIYKKKIVEHIRTNQDYETINDRYRKIWFMFNESSSIIEVNTTNR